VQWCSDVHQEEVVVKHIVFLMHKGRPNIIHGIWAPCCAGFQSAKHPDAHERCCDNMHRLLCKCSRNNTESACSWVKQKTHNHYFSLEAEEYTYLVFDTRPQPPQCNARPRPHDTQGYGLRTAVSHKHMRGECCFNALTMLLLRDPTSLAYKMLWQNGVSRCQTVLQVGNGGALGNKVSKEANTRNMVSLMMAPQTLQGPRIGMDAESAGSFLWARANCILNPVARHAALFYRKCTVMVQKF